MSNIELGAGPAPGRRLGRRRLMRAFARDWLAVASLVVLVVIVVMAFVPDVVASYSPIRLSRDRLDPPSLAHLMGTDQFGRDLFARIVHGAKISILVGFLTMVLAIGLGMPLGAIAGMRSPSIVDSVIMRIMEIIMAFPPVILAIAVVAALGVEPIAIGSFEIPHIAKLMFVIGILFVPQIARIMRSAVLVEKEEQYVLAERALGANEWRILFRDVLRNCVSPVIVHATLLVANAIILEASLGFLGLGIQPPHASWGGMLADAKSYVFSGEWWLTVYPGLFIFITVCGLNILGDTLRDLLDPRQLSLGEGAR